MKPLTESLDASDALLASTFTLVEALLELASSGLPPGVVERITRQRAATRVFEQISVPVAVFEPGEDSPREHNRAWRDAMRQ